MKRLFLLFWFAVGCWTATPAFPAEAPPPPAATATSSPAVTSQADKTTQAAATTAVPGATTRAPRAPDFLEHLVDSVLALFDIESSNNTITHYVISALMLVVALLARKIVTALIFPALRRLAAKTETTLDDKLFPALEGPVAGFVMLVGIFAALKVLKLNDQTDDYIGFGSQVAFSLVIFWAAWRAFGAVMDHAAEIAHEKQLGIAAFMPWLRKTLMVVFVIVGLLTVIQSLGYGESIKTLLAGLGIGGLAFALAAQDTVANVFGAVVVAVDQPFRIGDTVKIGANVGAVEDMGIRSTRIRLVDKSLMTIPNKTVAAETITNLSRFIQRRFEQVIGLTYDTKPEELAAIVEEFRALILRESEVDPNSVMVYFRDLNASSLDIWIVYVAKSPDFQAAMRLKQRLNLAFMRAVEARGLSFAFPTQTVQLAGEVAEKLAGRAEPPAR
jgi:MscS family membrane protein